MLRFGKGVKFTALGDSRRNVEPAASCTAGTELKELLASLGVTESTGCGCTDLAAQMDRNGIAWCKANAGALSDRLRDNAKTKGILTFAKAGVLAVLTGVAFALNPIDPYPGLVAEATKRAES
jgi:hypothetical protein